MRILMLVLIEMWFLGCSKEKSDKIYTPEKYQNNVHVSPKEYYRDSIKIHDEITLLVRKHNQDFNAYKFPYIDTTKLEILIDTILYDSIKTKGLVLMTVKTFNLNYYRAKINGKEVKPNKKFLYDGFAVLTKKNKVKWNYKIYYIHAVNYESAFKCLARLREIYFHELGPINEKGYNRYNIDDKRMWNEPIWNSF